MGTLGAASAITAEPPEALEGIWNGTLSVQGGAIELRLVFKVVRSEGGKLEAFLDSPDQGAFDIPVNKVTLDGDRVEFHVMTVAGHYEGTVDGDNMEGDWFQGGMNLPLTLERGGEPAERNRPQEPMEPFPYRSENVEYPNAAAAITLAGTLTMPESGGPFPAAILISGSGAQDRDELVFGHRPFLVLADHLTRQGIAVLRVDDRGVGGSTGGMATATSEDFAGDVAAGIEYLETRAEIDGGKVGLIGHSEGGIIAPMVANRGGNVAFVVLLAAPGVVGEELLYDQSALIGKAMGATDEWIEQNQRTQAGIFAVLKSDLGDAEMREQLRETIAAAVAELPEEQRSTAGLDSEEAIEIQIEQVMSPWFRFFLTYDPAPALRDLKCPVLAMIGEKDVQVPPEKNLDATEAALQAGGNPDYTVRELSGLNHLFQTAETGAPVEYGRIEETFAPVALETISQWILERSK
jgi:pimeloyl-ACP methyl ester carboxylesterase